MITIRKSSDRGHHDFGWLNARYTFSFARYYDEAHMGFRSLRVINQDVVAPGRGFPEHPHDNMEIITYVISGAIAHKDSTGAQRVVRPGQVQHMSAGSGVTHSEFNPSKDEPLHLLQIWIEPNETDITPAYDELTIDEAKRRNGLALVASPTGRDGSIRLRTDASVYATMLDAGREASLPLAPGRHGWAQVITGSASINGQPVGPGDGVAISDERAVHLSAGKDQLHALVFDLA